MKVKVGTLKHLIRERLHSLNERDRTILLEQEEGIQSEAAANLAMTAMIQKIQDTSDSDLRDAAEWDPSLQNLTGDRAHLTYTFKINLKSPTFELISVKPSGGKNENSDVTDLVKEKFNEYHSLDARHAADNKALVKIVDAYRSGLKFLAKNSTHGQFLFGLLLRHTKKKVQLIGKSFVILM